MDRGEAKDADLAGLAETNTESWANKSRTRPGLRLVQGTRPDLDSEVLALLRDRLRLIALLFFGGSAAFLVKDLVWGSTVGGANALWVRLAVTLLLGFVSQRLCSTCTHIQKHLRLAELLVFGGLAVIFFMFSYGRMVQNGRLGVLVPFYGPWAMLVFSYALFIPNTWRRALLVLTSIALMPVLAMATAYVFDEGVRKLIDPQFAVAFLEPIMVMGLMTTIAVWGVKAMRTLRSEAFEARKLGQYRLKYPLGAGGMGEVYVAEHLLMKRPCAIKLIRPEKAGDAQALARFEREVRATARLTHWNTVDIYDYGRTDDGVFYYVMEYLPGMNLQQLVENYGPMPASRVIHLLSQTCDALAEAHAQGMVHRDIKPANIFAAYRGRKHDVAKLLDFGLVRSEDSTENLDLTQQHAMMGSPLFMAPEQGIGERVDFCADVYSIGVVAYFLLTGRPPFQSDRALKVLVAHANEAPQSMREIDPSIPEDLERIVMRCLAKRPEDRFESAEQLRLALLSCSDAAQWDWRAADQWWRDNGCPHKKKLDDAIAHGDLESIVDTPLIEQAEPAMLQTSAWQG